MKSIQDNFSQSENISEISFESRARMIAFRLKPGQDLKSALQAVVADLKLQAAVVVTCTGSLRTANLRFAGRDEETVVEGPFEICALSGTVEAAGSSHLHISLSDFEGRTMGGHLMMGCVVHTTAEVVLAELEDLRFERAADAVTGYRELFIQKR